MEYIASLSYGKDSIAMLEIIKQEKLPLDRIVHVEVMATKEIPADLPPMMAFKKKADKIIKERYGIVVEHVYAKKTYEEQFYTVRGKRAKKENQGKIYGFPLTLGAWCNSRLKTSVLNKFNKKNIVQYIGIAYDEPNRFKILQGNKTSPLVTYKITEGKARQIAENLNLLSPIYTESLRGGCWFCHNQSLNQLRSLRKNYPEYWNLLLKWDLDSPVTFRANKQTVHDLEKRFLEEDKQI